MENLLDATRKPFLDVASDIHGSVVYLDAGAAEVAKLSLGPSFLLGLGALNVCDLDRSHPDDALLLQLSTGGQQPSSLVVFTTQLLTDTHQAVVRLLMVHPSVQRLSLFCSVSELAHAQLDPSVSPLGVEAYSEYQQALRQDLAAARAAAGLPVPREEHLRLVVKHLPLHIVALDSSTFVLPAAGAVASRAVAAGHAAGFAGTDACTETEADEDAVGISSGLSLLPHSLADLSRLLGARLEPFAIGPVATAIARELAALPQQGQRSHGPTGIDPYGSDGPAAAAAAGGPGLGGPGGSIGLVLIDRSLDLASPCLHHDHVLDVVFASAPRAEAAMAPGSHQPAGAAAAPPAYRASLRPADFRVDVPQLAPLVPLLPRMDRHQQQDQQQQDQQQQDQQQQDQQQQQPLLPLVCPMGLSLFHPSDRRWLLWLQQLWPKRGKDALLLLRKWLKEALRLEKLSPSTRSKLSSVVTPGELLNLAACLTAQPDVFLRHQPIIGLALAAAAALATDASAMGAAGVAAAPWSFWERLSGIEHQLLLTLPQGSDGEGLLKPMLLDAAASTHPQQARLLIDHVLQLLVSVYSLSGERMPPAPPLYSADEADIRTALVDALMAAAEAAQQQPWAHGLSVECLPQVQHLLQQAVHSGRLQADAAGVRAELSTALAEAFQRLRWLAACRGKLRDVKRLMQVDADTGAASSCTPLVRQVLTKILLQADNRDLQQPENASLVAGLLHRGLGRLGFGGMGGPNRPRISDYPAVLLFVVGGISPAEVREVRQELEEHKFGHQPAVLLGGTSLLTAADAVRLLFS